MSVCAPSCLPRPNQPRPKPNDLVEAYLPPTNKAAPAGLGPHHHMGQQGAGSRPNCFTTSGSIGDEATSNHVDLDRSGAFSRTQSHEISPTHEQPCSGDVPPHHAPSLGCTALLKFHRSVQSRWRMLYAAKILGSHARRPRTGMRNPRVGFLTSGEEQSRQGNSRSYD